MTQPAIYRKGTLLMLSGAGNHLHVVMNDPVFFPEKGYEAVLLVNISSVKPNARFDNTCLIQAGEHPFVRHASYISYADAVVKNSEDLDQFVMQGEVIPRDAISEALYERVLNGFTSSPRVTCKIKRFIKHHIY